MSDTFHVHVAGETKGPYFREQLLSMWNSGVLTADTLYWREESQEWQPVASLLSPRETSATTERPPRPPPVSEWTNAQKANSSPSAYRGLARLIDLQIFGIFAWPICSWSFRTFHWPTTSATLLGAVTVLMASLEVLWLMFFRRCTPGKWLFGMWIECATNEAGSSLIRRTYSVLWRCAPLFAPFCWPLALRDVKRTGTTKWDKKSGTRVLYRAAGDGREVVGVLVFLGCLSGLIVNGYSLVKQVQVDPVLPIASHLEATATPESSGPSDSASLPLEAAVKTSWTRVAGRWPLTGKDNSFSYKFLQSQITQRYAADPAFFNQANWPEILSQQYAARLNSLDPGQTSTQELEIKFIKKANRNDAYSRIEQFCGTNPDGSVWKLTADEAIVDALSHRYNFHTFQEGVWADVIASGSAGKEFLITIGDQVKGNNLLSLPECPE